MEKLQTAVEWLESELDWLSNYMMDEHKEQLFNQAKAMEKEQIKKAYEYGNTDREFGIYLESKQYYENNYEKIN